MQFVGSPPPDRRIIRLIGSGGMGVVYEAMDERLERRVALKVLHPHLTIQPEMRDRLMEEARLAARVEHENVVRIYNVHEVDTGLCLEMQYVDGVPLSQLLAGHMLEPPHAVDLLEQVLEALAACHGKNVVHADLKPGNLLVTHEGKVLLGDFGIARAVFPEASSAFTTLSISGPLWGTPQYCPPEAWQGDFPNPMWDLYALGVLVHEAVSGTLPFEAETPAMLMREKLEGTRVPLREKDSPLPAEIAGLVDDLTASAVAERPASAEEALRRLRQSPDYQKCTATTKPLRHDEIPAGLSMPLPITNVSAPVVTARGRWKRGSVGVLLLVMLSATFFMAGRRTQSAPAVPDGPRIPIPKVGEVGEVREMTVRGGSAFFSYDDGDRGRELWLADTSGYVDIVADINPGRASSNPRYIVVSPDYTILLAATTTKEGEEPWRCSASPPSAVMLQDLVPGYPHSEPVPIAGYKNLVYFYADTLGEDDGLWVTDGHHKRTGLVRDIHPEARFLDDRNGPRFVDEEGICKVARFDRQDYLMRYWFHDGRVESLGRVNNTVRELAKIGDEYMFVMSTPETGYEIWRINHDTEEAELLRDIWDGSASSDPWDFYVWKDELYFRAATPDFGIELWKTDGTAAGTVQLGDIHIRQHNSNPSNFTGTPDWLFFRAENGLYGMELWATNGDPASEPKMFNIRPGRESSTPYSMAVIGDYLMFSAHDGVHGEELWALDHTDPNAEPNLVEDILPLGESAEPHSLKSLGGSGGIFVYKTGEEGRYGLMRVLVEGKDIQLEPFDPLPVAR